MGPRTNFKKLNYYHLVAKRAEKSRDLRGQWIFILSELNNIASAYRLRIHAIVMMSNHFHCLISTELPDDLHSIRGEIAGFWNCEVHASKIQSFIQYKQVYQYIYRNPVEAGLARRCEEYPYSSLKNFIYQTDKETEAIPVIDQMCILSNPIAMLKWLNN